MQALADAKVKFRTSLGFAGASPGQFHKRHLLGYPVTNHIVGAWPGCDARLASQIRFKVARAAGGDAATGRGHAVLTLAARHS